MLRGFKTKLNLNNKQRTLAAKHAGVARHAWNWGLEICLKAFSAKEKLPTAIDLHKRLVAEVKSANPCAIADCGFYEFKRQLEYKASWYGSTVIKVDSFYPSSQLCSCCYHQQKMPLSKRTFKCSHCGLEIDRDLNASIILEHWHPEIDYSKTVSSTGLACGESDQLNGNAVKDSVKQEANIEFTLVQLSLFDLSKFE